MGLTVSESGSKEFRRVPEGVHRAVCVWLYDLGTQHNAHYNKGQKQVLIGWQFPDERVEYEGEDKPMMMSKTYTASLSEKAQLRKDLEAWRGRTFTPDELKKFDLKTIVGKCCQLQIVHVQRDGKTYANISSIMALPKGMPAFAPEGAVVCFDLDEGLPLPDGTPEWIATKIAASV